MSLFHTTFASALKVLHDQKVDCLMVGGHVVNYYGYARFTGDIDLGSCLVKDFGVSLNYAKTLAIKQVSGEKNSGVLLRGHSGG